MMAFRVEGGIPAGSSRSARPADLPAELLPARVPGPGDDDRLGQETIGSLFRIVSISVIGAAAGAVMVAIAVWQLGAFTPESAALWSGAIVLFAMAHVGLRQAYRRSGSQAGWRAWAAAFTGVALLEGMAWGSAPYLLLPGTGFEVEALLLLVVLGVAAGSISAFGPHLPAFAAFYLPTTLPVLAYAVVGGSAVHVWTGVLMMAWLPVVGGIGVATNRAFRQIVALRLKTEDLAESLRHQKEIAEQASLDKSSFLAAASHDLRQPVHAIGLLVGALQAVDIPAEGRRLIDQIEASTTAMDGLFTALLDISQLDAGIITVRRRAFAVGPFLERICREHLGEARAKGLAVRFVPCGALVETDALLLERILRNLVANAVRYTDSGRILVGCRRRGRSVSIEVCDSGRGIPADQHGRIFQEYVQLANPERDRSKGLGLGLAIVRRLTDLLGCQLTLRSVPGRGSRFAIEVPVAAALPGPAAVADVGPPGALAAGLVVVVDDERPIREAMSSLLAGWGHTVIAAESGDEAIARLADCPLLPSLLICDYRLRGTETGVEVVERLRSEYNEAIPAMLVTGDTAPDRLIDAQASGLVLLHKPLSNVKLRAALAHLLATAPAEP